MSWPKLWSQDGSPGCLLRPHPSQSPSQVALPPQGRWPGPPPDQAGGGDCLALLHRLNRTVLVGSVFVQQTLIAHLLVFRAWCSEVTKGQVGLEIFRVPSICAATGGQV